MVTFAVPAAWAVQSAAIEPSSWFVPVHDKTLGLELSAIDQACTDGGAARCSTCPGCRQTGVGFDALDTATERDRHPLAGDSAVSGLVEGLATGELVTAGAELCVGCEDGFAAEQAATASRAATADNATR
ncbi:MAG: hypothetical protein HOV77_19460 [Hamadaea sp.]|uniref:hypothetical protein n=1 Tax=Hamadaea sp. TaxID=2024425 RepID=UPI0017DD3A83|nr:hypothetical protein [Hamadaea sp.]NUT21357.1 hypothetical protein [Hamadaea sp.]